MSRIIDRLFGRAGRMRDSARRVQGLASRPTPPVRIDTGRVLPGWMLRLVLVGLAVVAMIMLSPPIFGWVILIGSTVILAARPNTGTGAVFVGVLGLFWMLFPTPPLAVDGFVLLALAVAVWTVAGTLSGTTVRSRVEVAIWKFPVLRWLILTAVGVIFLLVGQLLSTAGAGNPMLLGGIALAAAVVLAIAVWVILPRLSATPTRE